MSRLKLQLVRLLYLTHDQSVGDVVLLNSFDGTNISFIFLMVIFSDRNCTLILCLISLCGHGGSQNMRKVKWSKNKEKPADGMTNTDLFSNTMAPGLRYLCYIDTLLVSLIVLLPNEVGGFGVIHATVHLSFRPSRTIYQYLLFIFGALLVKMINTIDSRYHITAIKIDSLTLELLPLT